MVESQNELFLFNREGQILSAIKAWNLKRDITGYVVKNPKTRHLCTLHTRSFQIIKYLFKNEINNLLLWSCMTL